MEKKVKVISAEELLNAILDLTEEDWDKEVEQESEAVMAEENYRKQCADRVCEIQARLHAVDKDTAEKLDSLKWKKHAPGCSPKNVAYAYRVHELASTCEKLSKAPLDSKSIVRLHECVQELDALLRLIRGTAA